MGLRRVYFAVRGLRVGVGSGMNEVCSFLSSDSCSGTWWKFSEGRPDITRVRAAIVEKATQINGKITHRQMTADFILDRSVFNYVAQVPQNLCIDQLMILHNCFIRHC